MIASLHGTVLQLGAQHAVIEVGGIGYEVQLSVRHAASLRHGAQVQLLTTLIVREDALTLYGFEDGQTQTAFELLRAVSGIGPKSALAVIGTMTVDEMAAAIAADNDAVFRKVSGIGPKTAKLIVLSLAGKLVPSGTGEQAASVAVDENVKAQVLTALVGLGWPERVSDEVVQQVLSEGGAASVASVLRASLARLSPQSGGGR